MVKLTKDVLTQKLIDLNEKTNVYMERVANVLSELNDNNKTHSKALNLMKTAVDNNTYANNNMASIFNKMIFILFFLLVLVVVALIILAGVKNVKDILPFLPTKL